MDIERIVSLVITGLTAGSIYALLAMGYNVIFATTGVLNFAHGDLFMVGGMVGVWLLLDQGWPAPLAMVAAVLAAALLGMLEERLAVRPATSKGHGAFGWVLSTLGFAIVLRSGAALLFGPDIRPFPRLLPDVRWKAGDVIVTLTQVSLVAAAVVVALVLNRFAARSVTGRALGAIAQDPEAAALRGLPVGRLSMLSFAVGSGLAAFTGFLAGPLILAYPSIGFAFALKGFIAAAVGGIPEIRGALVGGLGLGLVEAFGVELIGAGYRDFVVFAVLLVVLGLRPAGIFGRESVRAV